MSSYVIKERERDWETTSVRSHREPQHYTTVRRYKVPDRDDRHDDRTVIDFKERGDDEEIKIVRRESRRDHDDRDVVSYRISKRDDSPSPERTERRIKIVREEERSPSPAREYRYERERDRGWDRNSLSSRPYELERYSKSTEFFSRPDPQPIIIRNEIPQPVIIRDEPRREREVIIQREVERAKSVRSASSSPSRAPSPRVDLVAARSEHEEVRSRHSETALIPAPLPPPQEDYYYERVTREVDRPRHHRDDDYREPRKHRDDRSHWSDDEMVYEKRVIERDESPHTKRHLAEGAIAGVAASALINHHRKKQGEPVRHRGRSALGYAAAGAVGAEVIARANSAWRDRSRGRSEEDYYETRDGRRHYRDDDRERGRSHSREGFGKKNTALAIAGLAAVAAGAYVAGKRGKGNTTVIEEAPRRSRSRRRRHSTSGVSDGSRGRSASSEADNATNPKHRNRRVAQAGLAGAALAGLAERRSRSRGKSKTRLQQGVPIVAAGLGSAAAAGLYENFKARRERKKSQEREASRSRSRPRDHSRGSSRSRSRSRSVGRSGRRAAADGAMVQYGADPFYNDDDRRHRSRSRGRSVSSSPRRRSHSRSRSRGQDLATAAAAAGVTGLAVNEARKRRERKREEKERRRREQEEAEQPQDTYYDPMQYYPATNQFPPPPPSAEGYPPPGPTGYEAPPPPIQAQRYDSYQQPAAYNPADYAPHPNAPTPAHQQQYYQQPRDAQTPSQNYYQQHPPPHGEPPESVSALPVPGHAEEDGVERAIPTAEEPLPTIVQHTNVTPDQLHESPTPPPAPSTPKAVHFNLPDSAPPVGGTPPHLRDESRPPHQSHDSAFDTSPERFRHHRRRHSDTANDYREDRRRDRKGKQKRDDSPDSTGSGDTIELPARFDERGRKIPESEEERLAMQVDDFLKGRNTAGRIFRSFADDFLVGHGSSPRSRR